MRYRELTFSDTIYEVGSPASYLKEGGESLAQHLNKLDDNVKFVAVLNYTEHLMGPGPDKWSARILVEYDSLEEVTDLGKTFLDLVNPMLQKKGES